ncbi:hypothetical protein B566_EDAN007894 [Ephemera danica]|nr:hypothetical protein B566_EDAN007894 [Ephemera danica]
MEKCSGRKRNPPSKRKAMSSVAQLNCPFHNHEVSCEQKIYSLYNKQIQLWCVEGIRKEEFLTKSHHSTYGLFCLTAPLFKSASTFWTLLQDMTLSLEHGLQSLVFRNIFTMFCAVLKNLTMRIPVLFENG